MLLDELDTDVASGRERPLEVQPNGGTTILHPLPEGGYRAESGRAGLIHLPLLPEMVAARGADQPSMDFPLMLGAVEVALDGVAGAA